VIFLVYGHSNLTPKTLPASIGVGVRGPGSLGESRRSSQQQRDDCHDAMSFNFLLSSILRILCWLKLAFSGLLTLHSFTVRSPLFPLCVLYGVLLLLGALARFRRGEIYYYGSGLRRLNRMPHNGRSGFVYRQYDPWIVRVDALYLV
jgi:hypothetical protein